MLNWCWRRRDLNRCLWCLWNMNTCLSFWGYFVSFTDPILQRLHSEDWFSPFQRLLQPRPSVPLTEQWLLATLSIHRWLSRLIRKRTCAPVSSWTNVSLSVRPVENINLQFSNRGFIPSSPKQFLRLHLKSSFLPIKSRSLETLMISF